jgi:hypothetical protein
MRRAAAAARRRASARTALLFAASALALSASAGLASDGKQGDLRTTLLAQIQPNKLPRNQPAPIAVFVSAHVSTFSGATPPQLQRMTIRVNRHGLLSSTGLPHCTIREIQPGPTSRALERCGDALVGSGRFWASIVLPGQRPYPTRGRLLVFNGVKGGRPVLFAHIYTRKPFATSFVITFALRHDQKGAYGTLLTASLPQALGTWGYVDRIKLTLRRRYAYRGHPRSYFNASCPAPAGTRITVFPLALATLYFEARQPVRLKVVKTCRVED